MVPPGTQVPSPCLVHSPHLLGTAGGLYLRPSPAQYTVTFPWLLLVSANVHNKEKEQYIYYSWESWKPKLQNW